MFGAGRGGDVAGETEPGFVGQQGKGDGFFRLRRHAVIVTGGDLQTREALGQHLDERGVFGAAAGDDEVAKGQLALLLRGGFHSGEQIADGVGNRLSGEGGGSGNDIFLGDTTTGSDECVHEFATEILTAGGFWSFTTEEWTGKNFVNHAFEDASAGSDAAIAIIGLLKETLGDGVDNHVPGTGVEGDHVFGPEQRQESR